MYIGKHKITDIIASVKQNPFGAIYPDITVFELIQKIELYSE